MSNLGFVDANVLADAIIAQKGRQEIMGRAKSREQAERDIMGLFVSYPSLKQAYDLFLLLRAAHITNNFVVTSNVALLEARQVIVEEYQQRQVARRKISPYKVHLSQTDIADIFITIQLFRRDVGHRMIVQDDFDSSLCERLVTEYGCQARDSILIATAIRSACHRFITRDERLKKSLRGFKKIAIVKAQTIADELRASFKIKRIIYSP